MRVQSIEILSGFFSLIGSEPPLQKVIMFRKKTVLFSLGTRHLLEYIYSASVLGEVQIQLLKSVPEKVIQSKQDLKRM
jgi:hypothetical protein